MRRSARTSLTLITLAGTLLGTGIAAQAASADSTVTAKYKVSGSTNLKAISTSLPLGPGTLISKVDLTKSTLKATLTLPSATLTFKEFGIIPVTATTALTQDGTATGKVNLKKNTVQVTASFTMQITSLTVAGLPVPVGNRCETGTPATVKVSSQKGFTILGGGKLAGSYTLPAFRHCGLATPLINLTIPGPGNTISLSLGKAKIS